MIFETYATGVVGLISNHHLMPSFYFAIDSMGIMLGLYWEKRGTRLGASFGLAIVILIGMINSFAPINMWSSISPYFSMQNDPWFYVVGVVAIGFAIRALVMLQRLPKKSDQIDGKKTIW